MFQDLGLLILRLGMAGTLIAIRGVPMVTQFGELSKTYQLFGIHPNLAIFIGMFFQLACTSLVLVGLATRLAALAVGLFVLMGVPWETPTLYTTGFFAIALLGPGRFSFDSFFGWFRR